MSTKILWQSPLCIDNSREVAQIWKQFFPVAEILESEHLGMIYVAVDHDEIQIDGLALTFLNSIDNEELVDWFREHGNKDDLDNALIIIDESRIESIIEVDNENFLKLEINRLDALFGFDNTTYDDSIESLIDRYGLEPEYFLKFRHLYFLSFVGIDDMKCPPKDKYTLLELLIQLDNQDRLPEDFDRFTKREFEDYINNMQVVYSDESAIKYLVDCCDITPKAADKVGMLLCVDLREVLFDLMDEHLQIFCDNLPSKDAILLTYTDDIDCWDTLWVMDN